VRPASPQLEHEVGNRRERSLTDPTFYVPWAPRSEDEVDRPAGVVDGEPVAPALRRGV